MSRFTIKNLRQTVEKINGYLAEAGIPRKLVENGRNGYQAVDAVRTDTEEHSLENVGCGTSRGVSDACFNWYDQIFSMHEKNQLPKINPNAYASIVCKVLGPTNTKGTRLKATCQAGSKTQAYTYGGIEEEQKKLITDLANQFDWMDEKTAINFGYLPGGEMVGTLVRFE